MLKPLRIVALILAFAVSSTALAEGPSTIQEQFAASLTDVPAGEFPVTGSFYVPAYSSVSLSGGRVRADFSVTLSVYNASEDQALILDGIGYFDTSGTLVELFVDQRIALRPYAAVQVYVPVRDVRGGTGANFVIEWAAARPIAEPVVEALMLGSVGSAEYSFISQGRPIRTVDR